MRASSWRLAGLGLALAVCGAGAQQRGAKVAESPEMQAQAAAVAMKPDELMKGLLAHEREFAEHRNLYTYLSNEKSERTGGHVWTERVVEAPIGHVRKLVAIDGRPLTAEEEAQERGRLAEVLQDPAAFQKHEEDRKKDELRARQMLQMLDRAFLFENLRAEGENVKVDFKPDPAYVPKSMEEKVLHSMVGTVTIDPAAMRMRKLEARLPEDFSVGMGLLATIKAGTNFATERMAVENGEWKGREIDTHVNGHILFFKTLSKNEHAVHEQFERVANDLTLTQAVARAEQ